MKTIRLLENAWKFRGRSNAYLLKLEKNIMIDTGDQDDRQGLQQAIMEIVPPEKIDIVIFTHLHYDHIGNYSLFSNAQFFAHELEIKSFKENRMGTVLGEIAHTLNIKIEPIKDMHGLKVIHTPGHTIGSVCILFSGLLFSGDTVFDNCYGRTDLPSSAPEKLQESISIIDKLEYNVLCPGHDY